MQKLHFTIELIISLAAFSIFMPQQGLAQTTTLNLSQDLVTLGIASTNMVPNQPSLDAGPLLQSGVAYAASHNLSTVIANPGTYYFLSVHDNTHVSLGGGLDHMTIDLHGADLIFTHPLYYGIILYYSTNAVLQNFTVDYQPLPFTQVRVVAVDVPNAQIQFSVEPGWPNPSTFNSQTGPGGSGPSAVELHIFRNGRPVLGRLYTQLPLTGNSLPIVNTPPVTLPTVRTGDIAVVAMRKFDAITTNHCDTCTLRNITVYSSGAAAVQSIPSPSSVMERVYSIPKPGTDRLVSTYGIGTGIAGPNNAMRLSRAIRTMDDGFFWGGRVVGTVENQINSRSLKVAGGASGLTVLDQGYTTPNGTPVTFQRPLDGVILGSAIIVSQGLPAGSPVSVIFNFDRDLPGNLVGTVMYPTDAAQNGANSVLERSTTQSQSAGRGINVAGLADSAVRGNYIRQSAFSGLTALQGMVAGEPPVPPLVNLNIANNVLDGTNVKSDWWWFEFGGIQTETLNGQYDLMTTSPHSNIHMTNNFIADSGRSGIWMGNTAGGTVSGNYILNANTRPDLANAYQPRIADALRPLVIDITSTGVVTGSNVIDNTSHPMFVTDTQYRELAAYAPGSTIRLNAYNLGTLANPAVTLMDADGKTISVTVQSTTAQAIDIQLPPTAALGGAYLTLTSGNAKYFGTLFIDSQDNIPAVNGCTYEASPALTSVPSSANTLSILVITQPGCAFQTIAFDPYATVPGTTTGSAVIAVSFTANTRLARTTTIEIAGQPITLVQASALVNVSVTPSAGIGFSQKFTALYSDSKGPADIQVVYLSINTSSSMAGGCFMQYVPGTNLLYLMNNAGTAWLAPGTPGSAGTLLNSQCTVDLQNSSAVSVGNNLTVNYALNFATSFSGSKSIFMNIWDLTFLNTGTEAKGSWIVGLKKTGTQLTSQ